MRIDRGWIADVDFATRLDAIVIQGCNTFARFYQRIRDAPGLNERFDELNMVPLSPMHSRAMRNLIDATAQTHAGFLSGC